MDREAWCAAIHRVAKIRTRLSNWSENNFINKLKLIRYILAWKFIRDNSIFTLSNSGVFLDIYTNLADNVQLVFHSFQAQYLGKKSCNNNFNKTHSYLGILILQHFQYRTNAMKLSPQLLPKNNNKKMFNLGCGNEEQCWHFKGGKYIC